MSYEFLEDIAIADIAFRAWGENLEEVFKAAGDATINAMIDNLFNFLQEFVYYKDSELLLLRAQQIEIEEKNGEYHLSAVTQGETLDRDRHEERVDVKAVTLHRFQLEKTDDGWTAMVILDI